MATWESPSGGVRMVRAPLSAADHPPGAVYVAPAWVVREVSAASVCGATGASVGGGAGAGAGAGALAVFGGGVSE
jgi:hypothetical protein